MVPPLSAFSCFASAGNSFDAGFVSMLPASVSSSESCDMSIMPLPTEALLAFSNTNRIPALLVAGCSSPASSFPLVGVLMAAVLDVRVWPHSPPAWAASALELLCSDKLPCPLSRLAICCRSPFISA